MRILFLSAWYPFPANNGIKLRLYNLLRGLAAEHEITLISYADEPTANPDAPEMRALCHRIELIPVRWFRPNSLKARLAFFRLTPRSVIDTYLPEMEVRIRQVLADGPYDVIVAAETRMAGYVAAFGATPALFEDVETFVIYDEYAQASSAKARLRYGLTWWKQRRYLRHLLAQFAAATVVSQAEQVLVQRHVLGDDRYPIYVIPNCMDLPAYADVVAAPQQNTLVFAGSFSYFPNHEAMVWFIEQVLPLVQAQIPDVRLLITGNRADKPLPPNTAVTHLGFVDDVRQVVADAWVSVAPFLAGSGTRLKVLEAMALHTPVVATRKGAEGIAAQDGREILLADSAEEFATAVVSLLQDPTLRQTITENAYRLVESEYNWTAVWPRYNQLLAEICHTPVP